MPSSNHELKEYGVLFKTVLPVVSVPFPSFPDPCQFALAFRVNFMGFKYLIYVVFFVDTKILFMRESCGLK